MILLLLVLLYSAAVRCPVVLDTTNQQNAITKKYCPSSKGCAEGTHVMCMYYNPDGKMGSTCPDREARNITLTADLVGLLLDFVNTFRGKVATGKEIGRYYVSLPRAYGLLKVFMRYSLVTDGQWSLSNRVPFYSLGTEPYNKKKWDDELATFAQVWANQCSMRYDQCRATEKFRNPAQMVSVVRFTYPDWKIYNSDNAVEILRNNDIVANSLTTDKLRHSIDMAMKTSYNQKNMVQTAMIGNAPDINNPRSNNIRVYLTMIYKGVTHMGCGMSAYPDYHKRVGAAICNTVQLVCNFSGQPREGTNIFDVRPKIGTSPNCGCPPNTKEGKDCLCVEEEKPKIPDKGPKRCGIDDPNCRPSVALFPIITVEDAPPEMLYKPPVTEGSLRIGSRHNAENMHMNILKSSEDYFVDDENLLPQVLIHNMEHLPPQTMRQWNRRIDNYEIPHYVDYGSHYLDEQFLDPDSSTGLRYRSTGPLITDGRRAVKNEMHTPSHRSSIFTRVSQFKLPLQNKHVNNGSPLKNYTTQKRKDVLPRRDFAALKNMASTYLNKIHTKRAMHNSVRNQIETISDTPKPGIAGFNTTLSKRNFEIRSSNEEADKKLLSLLDNLEEEVKHIQFRSDIKDIVNAKIHKIYDNFIGDANYLLKDKYNEVKNDFIKKIEEKYLDPVKMSSDYAEIYLPELDPAIPQRRHQNSIMQYGDRFYGRYRNKYGLFNKNDRNYYGHSDKTYYHNDDERHRYFEHVQMNDYYSNDDDANLLRVRRRKHFHTKFDNMGRKLKSIRGQKSRSDLKDGGHILRPVLSHASLVSPGNHVDAFYVPDRAKFLHSF